MPTLSLVADNNPSWIREREENGRRNYFMINLHKSMGPDLPLDLQSDRNLQSDTLPTALHCLVALVHELLSNNSLFVGQLYEDKSLALGFCDLIFITTDSKQ